MTPEQELAELTGLTEPFPDWSVWRAQDDHGQPHGWQATRSTADGSTIVAADSLEQLLRRIRQLEEKEPASR